MEGKTAGVGGHADWREGAAFSAGGLCSALPGASRTGVWDVMDNVGLGFRNVSQAGDRF